MKSCIAEYKVVKFSVLLFAIKVAQSYALSMKWQKNKNKICEVRKKAVSLQML